MPVCRDTWPSNSLHIALAILNQSAETSAFWLLGKMSASFLSLHTIDISAASDGLTTILTPLSLSIDLVELEAYVYR